MENSSFESKKRIFIEKVKKTKYCRINAYKRCNEWKTFLIFLSFIYNMGLIVAAILSVSVLKDFYWLNVFITVLSVIVFAISLFVSSLDYSRKANEYCRCYETLDELIHSTQLIKDEKELNAMESKYNTIICFSLNHEECDYYRFKFEYPDGPNSFSQMDDGTVRDEQEALLKANSEKIIIAKKFKTYKAKVAIYKSVLTGFIFYPLYLLFALIIRGRVNDNKTRNRKNI